MNRNNLVCLLRGCKAKGFSFDAELRWKFAQVLKPVSPLPVLIFDLRNVLDADFEVESTIEACGVPHEACLPAVQASVQGQILGRKPSIFQVVIGRIGYSPGRSRVESEISFDPGSLTVGCPGEGGFPNAVVVTEVESPRLRDILVLTI